MRVPVPADEPARLAALHDTQVLETAPEQDFDDIAQLASEICGTPMGLVSLIDENRQWFKAKVGLDLAEARRELSFCAYTINGFDLLEVPDATQDERFATNPYVLADNGIRFYAGVPVVLDGRHAVGTVCVIDIVPRRLTDEQKRALRTLARHAAVQLEVRRYARRNSEIADRMYQLDRMKDSFLATVSHELRTPLSSIKGYLEILLEGACDDQTSRRFLAVMERNSDRLLQLIEDLLMVARLTDAGIELELTEVDLAELARQVIETSQVPAEQQSVRLIGPAESATAPAHGDAKRLTLALNHLVTNAIKFTPPGGEVSISATAEPEPELIVTDNGVGIPPDEVAHVFDRFFRSASTDVMALQGPGLGLAVVKSIIESHYGSVQLRSEQGVGTTVRLTLPYC